MSMYIENAYTDYDIIGIMEVHPCMVLYDVCDIQYFTVAFLGVSNASPLEAEACCLDCRIHSLTIGIQPSPFIA